jgi:dihydroxyacid dehydratase/phosphogluconate dehydratase
MLHKIGVAADNRLVIRLGTPRGFNGNAELKSLTEKIEKTRQYRSNN